MAYTVEGIVNGKPAIIGMHSCHNHEPFSVEVFAQNGWNVDGTRRVIIIPNNMSKECRFAADGYAKDDPRCDGCSWLSS